MTNGSANGNGKVDGLTTPWLAGRLGIQSAQVEAMRRSGELLGVPVAGTRLHAFPAWQFDRGGRPLPSIQRLIRTARAAGVDDARLYRILGRRSGLTGGKRVVDELRSGNDVPALRGIAAAAGGSA